MRLTIRNNKVFFFIIGLLLIIGIVIGIKTRNSFKADTTLSAFQNNLNNSFVTIFDEPRFSQIYFDENANNFIKLKNSSDIILKVIATKDRKLLNQTMLTKVKVNEVYKGLDFIKDKEFVYIYEPFLFNDNNFSGMNGYNIMNDTSEYIVFLKKLKVPKKYKMSKKEKISFMFTNAKWSKFNMDSIKSTDAIVLKQANTEQIKYSNVKKYNQFFLQNKDLVNYNKIKQDILKNLDGK